MANNITVRIVGDSSSFKRSLDDAGKSAKQFQAHIGGLNVGVGSLIKSAAGLAGAGALGGLAASVVKTGFAFDNFKQQAQIAFTTMLGDGQKARSFLDDLQAFAAKTPFEFQGLVHTTQTLMAMGFNAKEVIPTLTAVGDAVAGLGGGQEQIDRITTALGQMRNAGRVNAQDMNQLTQAGINGWQILATSAGKSIAEMRDLSQKGMLDGRKAAETILAGMEAHNRNMMAEQSKTFGGMVSTLKDVFSQLAGTAMKPLFDLATKGLAGLVGANGKLLDSTGQVTKGAKEAAQAFGQTLANAVKAVVDFFKSNWPTILNIVKGLGAVAVDVARFIKAIVPAAEGVVKTLGGWKGVLAGIGAAVVTLKTIMAAFWVAQRVQAVFTSGVMKTALITTGIGAIVVAVGIAVSLIINHWDTVKKYFLGFASGMAKTFKGMWDILNGLAELGVFALLGEFEVLLKGATKALGWIPGIGTKIKHALEAASGFIDNFRTTGMENLRKGGEEMGTAWSDAFNAQINAGVALASASVAAAMGGTTSGTGQDVKHGVAAPGAFNAPGGGVVATATAAAAAPGANAAEFHLPGERNPYDCSAFTQAVFARNGISIGGNTYSQVAGGRKVDRNDIQAGDLVFFNYPGEKSPGHVGIATSATTMVHDHGRSRGVQAQGIDFAHYVTTRCYITDHVHAGATTGGGGGGGAPPAATDLITAGKPKPPHKTAAQTAAATLAGNVATLTGDVKQTVSQITKSFRDNFPELTAEIDKQAAAIRARLSHATKADLPALRRNLAELKAALARGYKQATDVEEIDKALRGLRGAVRNGLIDPGVAAVLRAHLDGLRTTLDTHLLSDDDRKKLETRAKSYEAQIKSAITSMTDARNYRSQLDTLRTDLTNRLRDALGLPVVYATAAATADAQAGIRKLTAQLQRTIDPQVRARLKTQLDGLVATVNSGMDGMVAAVEGSRSKLETAWGRMTDKILGAFDRITEARDKLFDEESGALTPAEQALKDLQATHDAAQAAADRADAERAVTDAKAAQSDATQQEGETAEDFAKRQTQLAKDVTDAQKRLNDLDYQDTVKTLQDKAAAERKAQEADVADRKKAYDDERAEARTNLQDMLQDQLDALEQHKTTLAGVGTALGGAFGDAMGTAFGTFAGTINTLVDDLWRKADAASKAAGGAGIGPAPAPSSFGVPLSAGFGGFDANGNWIGASFAAGGIVTRPTIAMVGESGREAIVPLGNRQGLGETTVVHVHVAGSVISERDLVETVQRGLLRKYKNNTNLGFA